MEGDVSCDDEKGPGRGPLVLSEERMAWTVAGRTVFPSKFEWLQTAFYTTAQIVEHEIR
jgi:hypothetical protein